MERKRQSESHRYGMREKGGEKESDTLNEDITNVITLHKCLVIRS